MPSFLSNNMLMLQPKLRLCDNVIEKFDQNEAVLGANTSEKIRYKDKNSEKKGTIKMNLFNF